MKKILLFYILDIEIKYERLIIIQNMQLKIDHISVRLPSKTMKSLIQFHAGTSVSGERVAHHSFSRHLEPVMFSCLPCSYGAFDCFKCVHSIFLSFIHQQSLKEKNIFPFTYKGGEQLFYKRQEKFFENLYIIVKKCAHNESRTTLCRPALTRYYF